MDTNISVVLMSNKNRMSEAVTDHLVSFLAKKCCRTGHDEYVAIRLDVLTNFGSQNINL